jgi:hypothetical protein
MSDSSSAQKRKDPSSVSCRELTWVFTPPDAVDTPPPPGETRVQKLPLYELGWQNFERLCTRLGQRQSDADYCQAFGVPGQEQFGIDLYIRQRSNGRYTVLQCKCCKSIDASGIKTAVDVFLEGDWPKKTDIFGLATSADMSPTQLADAESTQAARLQAMGIHLRHLDVNSLSAQLKRHPDLVDDFFGSEWVKRFCGVEAVDSLAAGRRLSPPQTRELRSKLRLFYSKQFQSVDPGLPAMTTIGAPAKPVFPLASRYVPLDAFEDREIAAPRALREANSYEVGASDSIRTNRPEAPAHLVKEQVRTRRPLFELVAESERLLLIGDPGSGKSASLRFLLMDLLSQSPTQAHLAAKWGNRLPVWVPFSAWTRMVAEGREHHALRDVLEEWLHNIGAPEAVTILVIQALEDERLLLCVDGLDEWTNEVAANTVLSLLNTFLHAAQVPAIATARPLGLQRLSAGLGDWQILELAGLSEAQQTELAQRWFAYYVGDASMEDPSQPVSNRRTTQFVGELRRDPALGRIAEIPLLISGLIGLSLSGWHLPRSRFRAYEELTKLLVVTHPTLRTAAALGRAPAFALGNEEVIRALAKLAHVVQGSAGAVSIPKDLARGTVAQYVAQRLHRTPAEAVRIAEDLLQISEDSIGIIVEKNTGEVGFLHRIFQEYLAARHLHHQPFLEQRTIVRRLVADSLWHQVLLCLFHLTSREDEADAFLNEVEGVPLDPPESFQREQLLAVIAFNELNASPARSQLLAQRTFSLVEGHWWFPLRRTLLDVVFDGLNTPLLRETVLKRLADWYPEPLRFSFNIFDTLAHWPFEPATADLMLRALQESGGEAAIAEPYALGNYARGQMEIANQLLALARSPVGPGVSGGCLLALSTGWPTLDELPSLLEEATRSRDVDLRLAGFIALVKIGRTDINLRDALLEAAVEGPRRAWRWAGEISSALIKGWPGDAHIRKLALDTISPQGGESNRLSWDVAGELLVRGYPQDNEIAAVFARRIVDGTGLHFLGPHSFWEQLCEGYANHPAIVGSVGPWLKNEQHLFGFDLYHAAICTRSRLLKAELLRRLREPAMDSFWVVDALVDTWGRDDTEVAGALQDFVRDPRVEDDRLGDTLLRLPLSREECGRRLVAALHGKDLGRRFSVIQGLGGLDNDLISDAVVEAAIASTERPVWQEGGSDRAAVILAFPSHPKVRAFAVAELRRRNAQISAVARAYANDPAMRENVRHALAQLPVTLRLRIVERLEGVAAHDDEVLNVLASYDADGDKGVKVAGACAYCTCLRSRGIVPHGLEVTLQETLGAVGHDCWERRLAALIGLAALGRLDLAATAKERFQGEPARFFIQGGLGDNLEVLRRLGRFWPDLMNAFGEAVWTRIELRDALGNMLDFVDSGEAFEALASRWEQNRHPEYGTASALRALAREGLGGIRLRRVCIAALRNQGRQGWSAVSEAIVAAEILGMKFGGDPEIHQELESLFNERSLWPYLVIAICAGWPKSDLLRQIPAQERPRNWHLPSEMWLACNRLPAEELLDGLLRVVRGLDGGIWDFLPESALPLITRVAQDEGLRTKAAHRLEHGSAPDVASSIPKLLSRSGGLGPELGAWCRGELKALLAGSGLTPLGCDILGARVGPVAHSLLDVLEGRFS